MNRTLLLTRTFFGRFFESELMPSGLPQVQLVIWSLALLAAPGLLFPVSFALNYVAADARGESLTQPMLLHRLLFITLTMTAIGLVALVIWDGVFPDRRDARILSSLPVPHRVVITARLLALAALCVVFLAGLNVFPTLVYGSAVGAFGGANGAVQGAAAHLAATFLAGLFVFTSLVALQGIVLNVGGRRAADRLSLLMQIVFVVGLLQMFFFLPRMGALLSAGLDHDWLAAIPSLWFLGLYDVVGGRPAPGAFRLAAIAMSATAATTAMAIGLFVATHGRLTTRALETPPIEGGQWFVVRALGRQMRRLGGRGGGKAVFEFTLRTLARARSHRLLMAMYVGVALAFVASAIVPLAIRLGVEGFRTPEIELLSAPFFLSFFTLVGMRVAIAIPVEPKANWAVRLGEPSRRAAASDGVRNAMLLVGVVPSVIVAAASAAVLWSLPAALLHAFVAAMMGWLLAELLLWHFPKLPFTCTYFPGTSRVGTFWPLYMVAFGNYTLTTSAFEWSLLRHFSMRPIVIFAIVVSGVIALLTVRRHRELAALETFRFEEEDPEATFSGFRLSESLAAATKESRQLR